LTIEEDVKDLWIETDEGTGRVVISFIKVEESREVATGVVFYVRSCRSVSTSELIHRAGEEVRRR